MFEKELEFFRKCFAYCPETGALTWKVNSGPARIGSAVGSKNKAGYINICAGYKQHYAHRVIFAMMTGRWPTELDHVNGIRSDNRWVNLRECTRSQNNWNRARIAKTITGVYGVGTRKSHGDYQVGIRVANKRIFIGYFKTLEEAEKARRAAEEKYHGSFRRDNDIVCSAA